jgi:hypothetical protein
MGVEKFIEALNVQNQGGVAVIQNLPDIKKNL